MPQSAESYASHLATAAKKVAESLGLDASAPTAEPRIPTDKQGGFVTLLGGKISLQLAILSDAAGTQALARALMCMEPDEPDLDDDEVADAVCEVANQVSGMMKRNLVKAHPDIRIGLPLMIKGSVLTPHAVHSEVVTMRLGDAQVTLVAILPEGSGDGLTRVA